MTALFVVSPPGLIHSEVEVLCEPYPSRTGFSAPLRSTRTHNFYLVLWMAVAMLPALVVVPWIPVIAVKIAFRIGKADHQRRRLKHTALLERNNGVFPGREIDLKCSASIPFFEMSSS